MKICRCQYFLIIGSGFILKETDFKIQILFYKDLIPFGIMR